MKRHSTHSRGNAACAAFALFAAAALSQAATLKDMTLVWTGNRFDPSGVEEVDVEPSAAVGEFTPQATLEARSDLGVLQDTRQGSKVFAAVDNTMYFTDPEMPAVFFDFTANARAGGAGNQTPTLNLLSSGPGTSESFRVIGDNNVTTPTTLVMELGTYNEGSSTFTANKQVQAFGFVMNQIRPGLSVTVEFKTSRNGTVLATQSVVGSDESSGNGVDVFFGYASQSYNIGAVVMKRTATVSSMSQSDSGIDDIGWTKVPLPPAGTVLLLR